MSVLTALMPKIRNMDGREPITRSFPEAASQSFKKGDLLAFSSGKLAVATSQIVAAIAGWAMRDASGTTDTMIPVALAVPQNEALLPVRHGTAASAVTAVTQVGAEFGYYRDTGTGLNYCEIDDTTYKALKVVSLDEADTVGDRYGKVWCTILPYASAFGYDKTE